MRTFLDLELEVFISENEERNKDCSFDIQIWTMLIQLFPDVIDLI